MEEIDIPSGSDDDNLSETEEFVEQNVEPPFVTKVDNFCDDSDKEDDAGSFFQLMKKPKKCFIKFVACTKALLLKCWKL